MKTRPLKGYKSLKALNAFHTLLLGLKMLPAYMGERYEDFYAKVEEMPPVDQEKLIREAALFVELQKDEFEALASFAEDPNGAAWSEASIKNLGPKDLHEIIVAVSMEFAKIKIDFVSPAEKKN